MDKTESKKLPRALFESAGLHFHHMGLAVTDPQPAMHILKTLGYALSKEVKDPLQQVNLIFCSHRTFPAIELVHSPSEPNPLETVLAHSDHNFYHVCFSTPKVEKALTRLVQHNVRLIRVSAPKPAVLFGGQKVSFYFVKGLGLIEFLETRS